MKEEISGSGNGDLLKSLVSISDAINEQIFNANQTIDGSFINRQAIIADTGPIETLKLQLEEREQEEQDKDVVRTADEVLTQLHEEQEREREEAWDNSVHNFAGMDMNGVEIDSLMDFMKKPSNRQKLIAKRMQANGGDINKATQEVDNAILYGDLFKKIENHTATAEEKAKFNTLDQTPGVKETIKQAEELKSNPNTELSNEGKVSVSSNNTSTSIVGRANVLSENFPNAPNLLSNFQTAKMAQLPLDNKEVRTEKEISMIIAPQPKADAGFAV